MSGEYQGPLEKIDDVRWRIPQGAQRGMLADGILYADEKLLEALRHDAALTQLANVACLPGLVGPAMAMPDCHYGYGFPIGGVAAFDTREGIISPGGVGYDINCGVRLLRTDITREEVEPVIEDLADALFGAVPSGVGSKGRIRLKQSELEEVMAKGARWVVARGFGKPEDLQATEEGGCMAGADPSAVSERAIKRGLPQLGTLGSGNHFLEVQYVDQISQPDVAEAMGIYEPGQVTLMIHCGSRGLGHQICDDYLDVMRRAVRKYDIALPDPQLACAPVQSDEGQRYFAAMACAANYAWANRQYIMQWVREVLERVFRRGSEALGIELVWDVAHNIAKFEEHDTQQGRRRLCVHRKGATRAFGPGRPELPERYRRVGQPVIVPGDMGSASWLLVGTEQALQETWGSTCHGAGRAMSRKKALKRKSGQQVADDLRRQGIYVRSAGMKTLAEEMPEAYKDVDRVVDVCHRAGISRKVARLKPLAVIKG
ncbi:MAG: RtcB family protein [Armatimonadetes bacterium]|nr:RtcB family protein [Armatimonadota bacterium]